MMIDDISSVSLETKNINKVGLDMSSHSRKSQATTIANNIMTKYISLFKGKNISKGIQEMPILRKDKSLKDNSSSKDILLSKGENSNETLFFHEEKTKNISIISSTTLSDMEKKYLTLSEFIYNNPNGNGYYQTST